MVWPLAVRSTVSRASGAELLQSKALRCASSMKLDQRLTQQIRFPVAEQPLSGLVAALHDAIRRGHQHGVAQAVEHRVQVILGDGGFVQLLAHAFERELQVAELIVAHHGKRPGVIALADPVGALDQRRDGARQLPGDEPGAGQAQHQQRQGNAGKQPAHALDLHALLAFQLLAYAGQSLAHLGAAHGDPQTADTLHRRRHQVRVHGALEYEPVARLLRRGIAAAEQRRPVRVENLDSFDVALVEQPLGDCCDCGLIARCERGRERSAGYLAQRARASLQVGFQFLRHGGIRELVDVRRIDPVFVVRQAAQQQRQHRSDRQCEQQILGFQASRH